MKCAGGRMGGGDADAVCRVERARRVFNRLHIQPQGTTQQFNSSFMEPQGIPQQFNFSSLVFQPHTTTQLMTQEATLFARRVYVGGLPPSANEQTIGVFFNQVMAVIGGNTAGPGDAVCSVCMNHEQRFALVEFRLAEEASNAMALDGILFEGVPVKVRRPTDYNLSLAAGLGLSQPSRKLNLAAVGLTAGSDGGGLEDPDRIFVGGLPYFYSEAQVRELLESFGPLRGRANESASQPRPEQLSILLKAQRQVQMQKLANPVGAAPTKVVCLVQVVSADELKDDEAYEDIKDDMRQEACRYGNLVKVVIARPDPSGHPVTGVGKVFLEYADVYSATRAKMSLHGRKFDGKPVVASYYPEIKFANLDFDG
ncbi:unnamed protein product [Miscanthus lutarioriparius]|uniref:RRM domain-containing protein n=1 Tax=Miscanthus lutarioriparius TaxID=422564 RepID=A0A811Q1I8_9POAL|nr:unnamed protein product [Miscanthus lutarioriparius]